jgi:hypothetical protein
LILFTVAQLTDGCTKVRLDKIARTAPPALWPVTVELIPAVNRWLVSVHCHLIARGAS